MLQLVYLAGIQVMISMEIIAINHPPVLDGLNELVSPFRIQFSAYLFVSIKEAGKGVEDFRNAKLRHVEKRGSISLFEEEIMLDRPQVFYRIDKSAGVNEVIRHLLLDF